MDLFGRTGFRKISIGFLAIISIALLNGIISVLIIQENKNKAVQITGQIIPYVESLERFSHLVTESKMYATNWVYLPNSIDDKKSLERIQLEGYQSFKTRIMAQASGLGKAGDRDSLESIFSDFQSLLKDEMEIMNMLRTFEDYENPVVKFTAEEIVESSVLPKTHNIQLRLKRLIAQNTEYANAMKDGMVNSFNNLLRVLLITSSVLFIIVLIASVYISRAIRKPILQMKDVILRMGKGELPREQIPVADDVVGEMVAAVNKLSESFSKTSMFANEIGSGNLSAEYNRLGENDMLGNALINMRNSLKAYSEDLEQQVAERTREVVEKNEKLEVAYSEIQDSISYAKRIQEAILPSMKLIKESFPESFILYKPKDIVCGDFYWYASKGDEVIIAAVDCTGHGVPGALMTVVGNSLLNQIVNISNITRPSGILTLLDKMLLATLQQQGNVSTNDGMDLALCKYNKVTRELTFSGAKRPLYFFKGGELSEIKGDKFPIGSYQYEQEKVFTDHTITVGRGDTVYMFSDGYQDQFGGENGKKFMISQFRDLLKNIYTLPLPQQHAQLDTAINKWKGNSEQTDDILLIGIRF